MPVLQKIDAVVRKIISYLYRFILVVYALSILIRNNNCFDWYVYAIGYVIYISFFISLSGKEKTWSYLRLVNDFLFILFILYKKDVNDFHTFTLLLIPIVNTVNYSGKDKKYSFPFVLYSIFLFSVFFLRGYKFLWGDFIGLFALASILFFTFIRGAIVKFNNNLYDAIDGFYEEDLKIGKTHRLLQKVNEKLKETSVVTKHFFKPIQIICFKLKSNELNFESGTGFVIKYSITNEKDFCAELRKEQTIRNHVVYINDKKIELNIFILIKSNKTSNNEYVYFIELDKTQGFGFSALFINKILKPLFSKVTRVVEVENELKLDRKKYLERIKSKMDFVDTTIKAIHYLNNRLSPITNYFEMLKEYDIMPDTAPEKTALFEMINKEKEIAKNNIAPIIDRAQRVLKKSSNPYILPGGEPLSLHKLFSLIRQIWEEHDMKKSSLLVKWTEPIFQTKAVVNVEAFEYLMEEIITNIQKHAHSFYELKFDLEDSKPVIYFSDDLKSSEDARDLLRVADDFNQPGISELLKRTSHGLSLIKQFLMQMNVSYRLIIDEHEKTYRIKIILNTFD